jgi:hypothetical protein
MVSAAEKIPAKKKVFMVVPLIRRPGCFPGKQTSRRNLYNQSFTFDKRGYVFGAGFFR